MYRFLLTVVVMVCLSITIANAQVIYMNNASPTGTTVNKLAKLTGSPSTAIITTTTDVAGGPVIMGVVTAGSGTTGQAVIATGGVVPCIFDAAGVVSGHFVVNSTLTNGSCADGGAAVIGTLSQAVGLALQPAVGGGTANMLVFPPNQVSPTRAVFNWASGTNYSTKDTPFARVGANGGIVIGQVCLPEVLVGGVASFDVYASTSTNTCVSGTKLNSSVCDANTQALTEQSLGNASTTIPANSWLCVHATGAGWTANAGVGTFQITYFQ